MKPETLKCSIHHGLHMFQNLESKSIHEPINRIIILISTLSLATQQLLLQIMILICQYFQKNYSLNNLQ